MNTEKFIHQFERNGRQWTLSKRIQDENEPWQIVFKMDGHRVRKTLKTSQVKLAEQRAIKLFIEPAMFGAWEKIIAPPKVAPLLPLATVQQIVDCYVASARVLLSVDGERTVEANVACLRRLVRVGLGVDSSEVDSQLSSVLTLKLAVDFQRKFCSQKRYTENRLSTNRGHVSANAVLRSARSLFSKLALKKQIYESAELRLPDLAGFMGCPLLSELKIDNYQLPSDELFRRLWTASDALKTERPALWLVWWLCNATGLRAGELQAMRWRWFQPHAVRLSFETDFIPKGKREREIPVSPDVLAGARAMAASQFWPVGPEDYVLPGTKTDRAELFRELAAWMTANGWTRRQKAHELRKVFASDFVRANTAYAAQLVLGHQEITTTQRYAARPVARALTPADRFGAPIPNVVPMSAAAAE